MLYNYLISNSILYLIAKYFYIRAKYYNIHFPRIIEISIDTEYQKTIDKKDDTSQIGHMKIQS